jgi:hypothetical protein
MRRRFYGSKILPMVTKHGLCVEAICGSRSCVLTLVLRDSRQIFPSLLCFDQNRHFCVNTLLLHRPGHRTRATDPGRRCARRRCVHAGARHGLWWPWPWWCEGKGRASGWMRRGFHLANMCTRGPYLPTCQKMYAKSIAKLLETSFSHLYKNQGWQSSLANSRRYSVYSLRPKKNDVLDLKFVQKE